jgi:hypothetical protein
MVSAMVADQGIIVVSGDAERGRWRKNFGGHGGKLYLAGEGNGQEATPTETRWLNRPSRAARRPSRRRDQRTRFSLPIRRSKGQIERLDVGCQPADAGGECFR